MKYNNNFFNDLDSGLYVVATPIGNLGDLSIRAKFILESCDLLIAEDTRVAIKLLSSFNLNKPKLGILSMHKFNESKLINELKKFNLKNLIFALISDAGTPTICDPGSKLVNFCYENGIKIFGVPGPCSFVTAFSVSGFETVKNEPLVFWGFFPRKTNDQISRLKKMMTIGGYFSFFETSTRLKKSLNVCKEYLGGNCKIFIGREITKKFETLWKGKLIDYLLYIDNINIENKEKLCGEFVVIVEVIKTKQINSTDQNALEWIEIMRPYLRDSELATILSKRFKITKNHIYSLLKKNEN